LQLSIRCSSIHFLPSRSFPVSESIMFGAVLESPAADGRSSAKLYDVPRMTNAKARTGPRRFTGDRFIRIVLQREIV
jgi:hypothetical protein